MTVSKSENAASSHLKRHVSENKPGDTERNETVPVDPSQDPEGDKVPTLKTSSFIFMILFQFETIQTEASPNKKVPRFAAVNEPRDDVITFSLKVSWNILKINVLKFGRCRKKQLFLSSDQVKLCCWG